MTHPAAIRQEALARVAMGESMNGVATALGLNPKTVQSWAGAAREKLPEIGLPVKERIGKDLQLAMVACVERTLELLPDAATPRDTAYAAKCMSDAALDWLYGRKGTTLNVDARSGDTNTIVLARLETLSDAQLRAIAEGQQG